MALRRELRAEGIRRLAAAGIEVPASECDLLLSMALGGVDSAQLVLIHELDEEQTECFRGLLARRENREPYQHITGQAWFRYLVVGVGPGVFVPRPETELLAGWAVEQAEQLEDPVVVDLCTGSGVIALSVFDEVPNVRIHAVELDETAYGYARRNMTGTGIDLRHGDMATAFDDLAGQVDVVVCNPPYIPLDAWESVAPEARDHDPHLALFSGDDGLDAMRVLERRAALLLKPGGVVGAEHADAQGESAPAVFRDSGRWTEVVDHRDLDGRQVS